MIFNYAVVYAASHEDLQKGFEVTPDILNDFRKFLEEKNFTYVSKAEEALQAFRKAAERDGLTPSVESTLAQIEQQIAAAKQARFAHSTDFLKRQLAMEISAKLWDTQTKIEASFSDDKDLEAALRLLKNRAEYDAVLAAKGK